MSAITDPLLVYSRITFKQNTEALENTDTFHGRKCESRVFSVWHKRSKALPHFHWQDWKRNFVTLTIKYLCKNFIHINWLPVTWGFKSLFVFSFLTSLRSSVLKILHNCIFWRYYFENWRDIICMTFKINKNEFALWDFCGCHLALYK